MITFRFGKKAVKHHFDYMGWMYILLPVILVMAWSLIYTFTEYRPPDDKVLSLYLVGSVGATDYSEALAAELAPAFPEMEDFDVLPIPLSGVNDYYNWQRFTTLIYAQQGDVYVIDAEIFDQLVGEQAFLPLDGQIDTDIDLTATTRQLEGDDRPRVYGVPADSLYGMLEKELYDNRRTVMVAMAASTNPAESAELIQWLIDNRAAEPPEGIGQLEERPSIYDEAAAEDMMTGAL